MWPRRWMEVQLYSSLNAALEGGEWSAARSGKDPVLSAQEAGWAPGPVWTGGKSRPHRDPIPDRPARSQSLYRLNYQDIYIYIYIYIQGIHKRMVRFQKVTRNLFLTLHGHSVHRQQRKLSKFLMRYQQFASHA